MDRFWERHVSQDIPKHTTHVDSENLKTFYYLSDWLSNFTDQPAVRETTAYAVPTHSLLYVVMPEKQTGCCYFGGLNFFTPKVIKSVADVRLS